MLNAPTNETEGKATFRIKIGNDRLEFQRLSIADPVPIGRQILSAAKLLPVDEHLIFVVRPTGALRELRLDETIDLRKRGVERFVTFRSDRSFRFILDGRRFEWGAATIMGKTLKLLAKVDPDTNGVWLERKAEPDLLIGDGDSADLTERAVERFRTSPFFQICIENGVFPWPRPTITTEGIAQLGGWDPEIGVIEVDSEQNERTLAPGEVVELKPGNSYGKPLCFKRGSS